MTTFPIHASEVGAAAAATDVVRPMRTSVAALLTRHILCDGELVLLILKPSLWFIIFSGLRFSASVLILMIAAQLKNPALTRPVYEAGLFLIAARVMWAVLNWMGRLYVLTDLRIIRLSGVFNVEIFDCALRRVAHTRVVRTTRERLFRLGSVEIIPADEEAASALWQTVRRPHEVHRTIQSTIARSKM